MGISGLLPFLKIASKPINIREYSGSTVAIDSYCWLHKGAFSCAEKLARGEDTDQYVTYCMKFVNMLLTNNIKPILVFDGRHLPAKAETEKVRRQRRETNRRKAAELLRMDRGDEARSLIQRCVDVTHDMASALIKKCHASGVDCIVAPFEADAQLAYLCINNIAHIVITEDSDLMLFGCKMVLFKMDVNGNGLLVEQDKIPLAMKQRPDQFSMDKFRHMCILSGCDYLPSLPGIGLQKACKFIKRTAETDIIKALTRLGAHLNMSHLVVTPDYKEKFLLADAMFKHQLVFDPKARKVVCLTPLPDGMESPISDTMPSETSYQLALGNLNPFTLEKVDNWDPDQHSNIKSIGWSAPVNKNNSIWSKQFANPKPLPPKKDPRNVTRKETHGTKIIVPVDNLVNKMSTLPQIKPEEELNALRAVYGVVPESPDAKCIQAVEIKDEKIDIFDETFIESPKENVNDGNMSTLDDLLGNEPTSPVLNGKTWRNPFSCKTTKTNETPKHSSCVGGIAKMIKQVNKTVIDENVIVQSRFFAKSNSVSSPQKIAKPELHEEEDNIDILADILHSPSTPSPKKEVVPVTLPTTPKNIFPPSPKKSSNQLDFYNSLKDKTDRPSFLNLIDSVSKKIAEEETIQNGANTSSFNWSNKKKQCSLTTFISPNAKDNKSKSTQNSSLKPPTSGKTPPNKSPLTSSFKSPLGGNNKRKIALQPAKAVGLKRKKTNAAQLDQPSVFEMFAFQPKNKMKSNS